MVKASWRKLPIQEIDDLWNRQGNPQAVLDEIVRAYQAGARFQFGVDRLETGYRLTIRSNMLGIYLVEEVEEDKLKGKWSGGFIVPDQTRAGSVDWWEEETVVFYVSPDEFDRFRQEAEQIFVEYFFKGNCFRMIPDIWFDDMALVQFMRERLCPHPAMKFWFGSDNRPTTSFGWSQKFDR